MVPTAGAEGTAAGVVAPKPEVFFSRDMALLKDGREAEDRAELKRAATAGHMEARFQLAL